jgi:hypothetical protein
MLSGVRVHVSTGYTRVEGNRPASRYSLDINPTTLRFETLFVWAPESLYTIKMP